MRWIWFAVIAYCAVVIQISVAAQLAVHGLVPNILLIVAAHYALWSSRDDALLACWILGFLGDLTSESPTGMQAFAFGLAGVAIVGIRATLFREHIISQLLTVFIGVGVLVVVHTLVALIGANALDASPSILLRMGFGVCVYTLVITPLCHKLLLKLDGVLSVSATRTVATRSRR